MKIIDKKSFLPTVCVIYTLLSVGKIVLEAQTQGKFGSDQMNMLTILLFSFLGTLVLSQHYRLAQLPLLLVAVLQYVVLIAAVLLFTWISGFFSPRASKGLCGYVSVVYGALRDCGAGLLWLTVSGGAKSQSIVKTNQGGFKK